MILARLWLVFLYRNLMISVSMAQAHGNRTPSIYNDLIGVPCEGGINALNAIFFSNMMLISETPDAKCNPKDEHLMGTLFLESIKSIS